MPSRFETELETNILKILYTYRRKRPSFFLKFGELEKHIRESVGRDVRPQLLESALAELVENGWVEQDKITASYRLTAQGIRELERRHRPPPDWSEVSAKTGIKRLHIAYIGLIVAISSFVAALYFNVTNRSSPPATPPVTAPVTKQAPAPGSGGVCFLVYHDRNLDQQWNPDTEEPIEAAQIEVFVQGQERAIYVHTTTPEDPKCFSLKSNVYTFREINVPGYKSNTTDEYKDVFIRIGETTNIYFGDWLPPTVTPVLPQPIVTQSGGRIVFHTNRDNNYEVYMIEPDGGNPINLTNHPANDKYPVWSPNGERVLFVSDRDGNLEIYREDKDGSNQTRLTCNPSTDRDPAWSPYGDYIAFVSNRSGAHEIYIMSADVTECDGIQPTRLTFFEAESWSPAWSPNGQEIAFHSDLGSRQQVICSSRPRLESKRYEIYLIGATEPSYLDGPNSPQRWSLDTRDSDEFPAWSPDGSEIAFITKPVCPPNEDDVGRPLGIFLWEILKDNRDRKGATQLTNNKYLDGHPSWSPDGKKIVFHSSEGSSNPDNRNIYVMNSDGSDPQALMIDSEHEDGFPDWSWR